MRSVALALLLSAALLSGCVAIEDPEAQSLQTDAGDGEGSTVVQDAPPAPPVDDAEEMEATPAGPHGEPQWSNGTITSGTEPNQVPSGWARQEVTVRNGFGELLLGELSVGIPAGAITVQVEDRADYEVRALIEVRAASEEQARDAMERTRLEHADAVDGDTLVLSDRVVTDPVQTLPVDPPVPLPNVHLGDVQTLTTIVVALPLHPAVDAFLSASSGPVSVSGLRGGTLEADTSSGGITVHQAQLRELWASTSSGGVDVRDTVADEMALSTSSGGIHAKDVVVETLDAGASSGGIELSGVFTDIEASTGSGGIVLDAVPGASGTYELSTSSGGIEVRLPAAGHAYKATADVSSGDIDIDIAGAKTRMSEDERHAEAESPGFEDAELATEIVADASSGGIEIAAR